MIKITEHIAINADENSIWSFIIDFSRSMLCNRFHISVELPSNYSIRKMKNFSIIHNFGFGDCHMLAEIKDYIAPTYLHLSELNTQNKGFCHETKYEIESVKNNSKLFYTIEGTYGSRVQDISFKPILKGVVIEELRNIKKAIESADKIQNLSYQNQ